MNNDDHQAAAPNLAAHAFGDLRAEVSLLRRAIERLTDERASQPDYSPSLEAISKRLEDVANWAGRISERPALKLTPESYRQAIDQAASQTRLSDQHALMRAADTMQGAADRIDAMIAQSRTVVAQNREVLRNRIGFAVAGIALSAILPGAIARSLPVSWAFPERIAARMLGLNMWTAGGVMMAKADPSRWDQIRASLNSAEVTLIEGHSDGLVKSRFVRREKKSR